MTGDLPWRKSSYSGSDGGDCVEVAHTATTVHVRDSKDQRGPVLSVPSNQWAAFIERLAR
ncbi:DUF397 domain-containing protein [Streptomyces spirodelae]|uniref:DUF397 domain-containing protein n=1 Tax=Streptomyces spirodelae TaxID=2812904 RepID=A0ABS3WU67_9ACTN|nr:DUF397 domain-containing protein [Streptomyces spirodelae]